MKAKQSRDSGTWMGFFIHTIGQVWLCIIINQFNPILTHAYRGIASLEGNGQMCPNWRVIVNFLAPLLDEISLSGIDD
jgi:hypothetical protein